MGVPFSFFFMNAETIRKVYLTAEEIKEKFGLEGELLSFSTPPKQAKGLVGKRRLLVMLRLSEEKKSEGRRK